MKIHMIKVNRSEFSLFYIENYDNQGNLTKIDNVDENYTRITNGIRDAIAPDVTMFVRYTLQDNKIIQIEVGEGSYKPYYLEEYGEMTDEDLRELLNIKTTRAYLLVRQMHENGLIEIIGRGASKKYKLK